MKLDSMTIRQILELTDPELDALSENEQRLVAEVIGAVLDLEMRRGSASREDSWKTLPHIVENPLPGCKPWDKIH